MIKSITKYKDVTITKYKEPRIHKDANHMYKYEYTNTKTQPHKYKGVTTTQIQRCYNHTNTRCNHTNTKMQATVLTDSSSSSVRRCTCGEQLMGVVVVRTEEVSLKHSLASLSLVTNAEYRVPGNERLGVGRLFSSFVVGEEQLEEQLDDEPLLLRV